MDVITSGRMVHFLENLANGLSAQQIKLQEFPQKERDSGSEFATSDRNQWTFAPLICKYFFTCFNYLRVSRKSQRFLACGGNFQKNPRVRTFFCLQFWGWQWLHQSYGHLEKLRSFCRKTSMPIKYLVLGGGGYLAFFLGGGTADFIFMGARIFLKFAIARITRFRGT